MAKKDCFCLDTSSLNEEQQEKFAKSIKSTVDDFNKTLEEGKTENGKNQNGK